MPQPQRAPQTYHIYATWKKEKGTECVFSTHAIPIFVFFIVTRWIVCTKSSRDPAYFDAIFFVLVNLSSQVSWADELHISIDDPNCIKKQFLEKYMRH